MSGDETLAIALAYHRAWTTTKDVAAAAALLADELRTDLPVNTYAGKPEFVEAIAGFGGLVVRAELLSACATDSDAMLIYDLEMPPLGTLRIAEQCTVTGGLITFIRHVHDTATMRAAGFAPPLTP